MTIPATSTTPASQSEDLVALIYTHGHVSRDVLEEVALDPERRQRLHGAAADAGGRVSGIVAYSTCLRTEVYAVVSDAARDTEMLRVWLARTTGASPEAMAVGRVLMGIEAVRHLMRVGAGLESLLLGEGEIHGQLRDALRGVPPAVAGPVLHRLFESASTAGARARAETPLGAGRPALGRAAANAAGTPRAEDRGRLALVVGAGIMARQAARQLRQLGWSHIAIANRSEIAADSLAREVGGTSHPLGDLESLIARAAVVVTAVGDSAAMLDVGTLHRAAAYGSLPRVIVDLGSPRNVAPDVQSACGVAVIDLDGFTEAARERREAQAASIPAVEAIVEDELQRFVGWWNHRRLVPFVRRLRETVQSAASAELDALLEGRSDVERETMRRLSHAMVNRLLHHPLTRLRTIAAQHPDRIGALADLEALFAPQEPSAA